MRAFEDIASFIFSIRSDFGCGMKKTSERFEKAEPICNHLCFDIYHPVRFQVKYFKSCLSRLSQLFFWIPFYVSITRMFSFQLLLLAFGPILFTSFTTYVAARNRELEHKKKLVSESEEPNSEEILVLKKEIGKVRFRSAVKSKGWSEGWLN